MRRHNDHLTAAVLVAAAVYTGACSSQEPVVAVKSTLCDLPSAPEGCSQPCSPASPFCAPGFQCGPRGHCEAECTAQDLGFCDVGQMCSVSGQCVPPQPDAPRTCVGSKAVAVKPAQINLMMLVDRSGSMNGFVDGVGATRWSLVQDFLLGDQGFLVRRQAQLRMSLSTFYALDASCPSMPPPELPALNSAAALAARLQPPVSGGQTPTAEALTAAEASLRAFGLPGQNVLLLITDGEPTGCAASAPTPASRQASIEAAKNAYNAGVRTYVVGVGPEVSDGFLAALAGAGQGSETGPVLRGSDQDSLVSAFNAALYPNLSCVIELEGARVTRGKECEGQVYINGQTTPLACNGDLGWRLLDETHIELSEDACYRYKTSATLGIQATFPCESIAVTI